jgi:uncharacterized protein (DUF433 family)
VPVYICYRGDCDHLAFQQAGLSLFVAKDALQRDWLCIRTELEEIPDGLPASIAEMIAARCAAHQQQVAAEGTAVAMHLCSDDEELRRELVLRTYPPVAESVARMGPTGWLPVEMREETGKPCVVTISKGRQRLSFQGETTEQAFYRAAQYASALFQHRRSVMPLNLQADPVPLYEDGGSGYRVTGTRVPLDVVLAEFANGAGPESIVSAYPTLKLADVYAVIAYYLRHQEEVDEHLRQREAAAAELRREIESKQRDSSGLRERLLARKAQQEQEHASARSG